MNNLVVSNIRQRPLRTLMSVLGVALGVTLVMLFTGLAHGMSNDLQRRSSNMRAEIIFTRPGSQQLTASLMNLSTQYTSRLEAIEGVERATPVAMQANQTGAASGLKTSKASSGNPLRRSTKRRSCADALRQKLMK